MNWLRRRGIAFKLSLMVLSGVSLVIGVILTINYNTTRQLMVDKIEDGAFNLAEATANRINTLLRAAEKIPAGIATTITQLNPNQEELEKFIRTRLQQNPELFGIAAAFEPGAGPAAGRGKSDLYSCYDIRAYNHIKKCPIDYDYRYHDWYQIPEVLNRAVWSEPYFGESGQIIMTSFSWPIISRTAAGKTRFNGIVCVDLSLNWLRNVVSSIKIGKTGFAFLITRNGTFVTYPKTELIMNETIFSIAEARHNPAIREIGRRMIAGEKGFTAITSLTNNEKYWLVYTPLKANGWSLGVLFPQNELMADINSLTKIMLGLGIGGFFLIMLVILSTAGAITKPLRALAESADQIASGNLEAVIPILKTRDEVGRLALSFADMQRSLKEYIKNLTETTAAKERIESELKIASEIQMGILPKIFPPPFPNRPEFALYTTIRPAREVGGDLYDFFMIDDQHLCFTVGDVSGKGVAAALFMAITQTLIKTQVKAQVERSTATTLEMVNNDLARDNPSMMFVTLFIGILNIVTGELEYCNGGHNPPYRLTADAGAEVHPLAGTDGIALGVMEDTPFSCKSVTLKPGETVFVFTDGVTEAMDSQGKLFTEPRLENILGRLSRRPVNEIAHEILSAIDEFSTGIPQTDDITMLIIRYNGGKTAAN